MAFSTNQSFEPRIGTAQMVFGVIYLLITLIALSLAFYARQEGDNGYFQLSMAALFAIMAIKSFFISARVKRLLREGIYFEADVESCEPVRGITTIKGTCDIPDYGQIHIESRLVGETIGHELKAYMAEHKQHRLPALVVGANGRYPRGMFTVKGNHGHLVPESAQLQSAANENSDSAATAASTTSSALDPATARAKAATRLAEQEKQKAQEQAQEQAQAQAQAQADEQAAAAEPATAPAQETTATGSAAEAAEATTANATK